MSDNIKDIVDLFEDALDFTIQCNKCNNHVHSSNMKQVRTINTMLPYRKNGKINSIILCQDCSKDFMQFFDSFMKVS